MTEEIMQLMKQRGTYLVPTTYLTDALDLTTLPAQQRAKAEKIFPIERQRLREAIKALQDVEKIALKQGIVGRLALLAFRFFRFLMDVVLVVRIGIIVPLLRRFTRIPHIQNGSDHARAVFTEPAARA